MTNTELTPWVTKLEIAPRVSGCDEMVTIDDEMSRLREADPSWFAGWEQFLDSIDDLDSDED